MKANTKNIYQEKGYEGRDHYLSSLAETYETSIHVVRAISDLMGENEDFDGLVTSLASGDGNIQI